MKTGILTFHNAGNYGAVLQAYALQQKLCSLGLDNEFVNITVNGKQEADSSAPMAGAGLFAKKIRAEAEKRNAHFDDFRKKYLKISENYDENTVSSVGNVYDALITGSDQVWNFSLPDFDLRYLLPFEGKAKKISYAASFGSAPDEKLMTRAAAYLNRFHQISVREKAGQELIEKYTDRKAVVLPDPTLLLDREDWDRLADSVPKDDNRYVLLFLLRNDPELAAEAKAKAAELGLELRTVCAGFIPQYGFDAWSGVGVEKWISLVKNAEYVYTNSFHGTVFSLIYGRVFRTAPLGGELSDRNGRLSELLSTVGLEKTLEGETVSIPAEELDILLRPAREAASDFLKGIGV